MAGRGGRGYPRREFQPRFSEERSGINRRVQQDFTPRFPGRPAIRGGQARPPKGPAPPVPQHGGVQRDTTGGLESSTKRGENESKV